VHTYGVHERFGHLLAPTILARLQLAALYAATCCLLPEPASRQSGSQTALQLLRQCWTNQPLQREELQQLVSVAQLGGHLAPGLHLLAYCNHLSAAQLKHYQDAAEEAAGSAVIKPEQLPVLDADAGTQYRQQARRQLPGCFLMSHRLRLAPDEEALALGVSSTLRAAAREPAWKRLRQYVPVEVLGSGCPVQAGYVAEQEARLQGLVVQPAKPSELPAYPLDDGGAGGTWLEQVLHQELRGSWEVHHGSPGATSVVAGAREVIEGIQVGMPSLSQLWRSRGMMCLYSGA
jgi:hypothetical protein